MYIAAIELSGRITRRGLKEYLPILEFVKEKKRVGGLIIVLSSEGGDANSSEIFYNKVHEIAEKKPVFSVIEGMGASGAYWIASASRKIYAMQTSLVGSIGVISISPNVEKFLDKVGIAVEVNKIGKFKDMTSPFREMDPESREKFMKILEAAFKKFRKDVVSSRKIPEDRADNICNGQIFSAEDALENGLIDEIGTLADASGVMAKMLSIKKKVKLFSPKRPFMNRFISTDFISGIISEVFRRY